MRKDEALEIIARLTYVEAALKKVMDLAEKRGRESIMERAEFDMESVQKAIDIIQREVRISD